MFKALLRPITPLPLVLLVLAAAASADDLHPAQAVQTELGKAEVNAYYTATAHGYRVVTTAMLGGADQPEVIRFVSMLQPGEEAVVSVPQAVGQPALELHLSRIGDRVEMVRSGAPAE